MRLHNTNKKGPNQNKENKNVQKEMPIREPRISLSLLLLPQGAPQMKRPRADDQREKGHGYLSPTKLCFVKLPRYSRGTVEFLTYFNENGGLRNGPGVLQNVS